jgi:hypothetical protein
VGGANLPPALTTRTPSWKGTQMATESRNNVSTLSQTPADTLPKLVRRLREHAKKINNRACQAMGQDMLGAALAIEQHLIYHDIPTDRLVGDLSPDKARALAEFLSRIGLEDCTRLASPTVTYDGVSEADTIWSGVRTLQRGLAEAGFAPR